MKPQALNIYQPGDVLKHTVYEYDGSIGFESHYLITKIIRSRNKYDAICIFDMCYLSKQTLSKATDSKILHLTFEFCSSLTKIN